MIDDRVTVVGGGVVGLATCLALRALPLCITLVAPAPKPRPARWLALNAGQFKMVATTRFGSCTVACTFGAISPYLCLGRSPRTVGV